MGALLLTAYVTVLIAELIGDKLFYTLGALATRFRPAPVMAGAAAAFGVKMLIAVLFGRLIGALPPAVVTAISAVTFFATGIGLWLKRASIPKGEPDALRGGSWGAVVAFT